MKGHFIQRKFTAGEWTKRLEGQTNLEKYENALYCLENFIIDPHGPVSFRPGFRYVAATKDSTKKSYLIPFEVSANTAYILEFGDLYIRFYKSSAQLLSGGSPYEIVSPYDIDDLSDVMIKFCESADVMYLFHKKYAPRKLSRTGDTSWVISSVNFNPPPLKEEGIKPNTTLTPAAVTGASVVFTSGASAFLSGDVGRLITSGAGRASITMYTSATQVTCEIIDDFASTSAIAAGSWTIEGSPNGTISPTVASPVGAICAFTSAEGSEAKVSLSYFFASSHGTNEYYLQSGSPVYQSSKPTYCYLGNVRMVEGVIGTLGIQQWAWGDNDSLGYNTIYVRIDAAGTNPDDVGTVKSSVALATKDLFRSTDVGKYIRVNEGLVKITAYASATSVSGEIIRELDSTTASAAWTLESEVWSATNGYPSCGTFYEERLVVAGCPAYPETVWGSVVGDYENFTPGTDDADAIEFTVSGREISNIKWVEPDEYLMVGSSSKISRVGPNTSGETLTPLNVVAKKQSSDGAADIAPLPVRNAVLYVMRTGLDDTKGLKVGEIAWSWEKEKYVTPDMSIMADHVTGGGLKGICYQKEPFSILWGWDEDGNICALTYLREEEVIGWHRHPTDGVVESMATIPGDGYDEVWAIIKRTINGSDVRYVEVMQKFFNDDPDTYITNKGLNAFFVDCGITYNGTAATTITGLSHLEGETVSILADGNTVRSQAVASGQITLDAAASIVHVGLPYTGTIQTMRPEASLADGTAQGRTKIVGDMTARVYRSAPFKAGRDDNNLDVCYEIERTTVTDVALSRDLTYTLGAPFRLFTGDIRLGLEDRFNGDGRITIVQDKPMPLTIVAIMPEVNI